MNDIKLSKYEKEVIRAFENGEFKTIKNFKKMKKVYEAAAAETLKRLKKSENINLRMTESDLGSIKSKAEKNGLPYQTLISTILHQYATGKIEVVL